MRIRTCVVFRALAWLTVGPSLASVVWPTKSPMYIACTSTDCNWRLLLSVLYCTCYIPGYMVGQSVTSVRNSACCWIYSWTFRMLYVSSPEVPNLPRILPNGEDIAWIYIALCSGIALVAQTTTTAVRDILVDREASQHPFHTRSRHKKKGIWRHRAAVIPCGIAPTTLFFVSLYRR